VFGLTDKTMNNREIKFRTWDKQLKQFAEWTNRDPFFDTSHGQIFFWERVQREDGSYDGDIILQDYGDRFVLQQYTGLKDKNGKEIYEGDICNAGMVTGPIEFIIGGFSLASNPLIEFLPKDACVFSPDYDPSWIDVEVVGNICEDPDYFKNEKL
jgi:hypothetical protein